MMAERSRSRLTSGSHAAISPLPQPGDQVFLRSIALNPIAVGAKQLQVLDVVLATAAAWDDVINLEAAEWELAAAAVAPTLLLAEQNTPVLAVGRRRVDAGAGRCQPVVAVGP